MRPSTLTFFALLLAVRASAQEPAPRIDPAAVDRLAAEQLARGGVGLSLAIVLDGDVVHAKGYGKRSLQPDEPVGRDTAFAIGSVTKQFTCACVLLLQEDGKLSVDDPVAKWFPALGRAEDITLRDLMHHVSGYPDYYPLDYVHARMHAPIGTDELLRRFAVPGLDFEPGTEWSYSNTGYVLLGRVVEEVSGRSFGAFLQERIFEPLGMRHTTYEPEPDGEGLAHGYTSFALGPPEPCTPEGHGWIGAAGGIWSTPSDLAKWDVALMDGRVLEPSSLELMTTPRILADGRTTGYGCGLGIGLRSQRVILAHTGAVDGFVASNVMVPSLRAAVVVVANHSEGRGDLPDQLLALVLARETHVPSVDGPGIVETVRALFAGLQRGDVDRDSLSADFFEFLTDARVTGAAARLRRYGAPRSIEVLDVRERGGMEVSTCRLRFAEGALRTVMYRRPDGKVEQFFVERD